ncbi:MAG: hypothetical protein PVF45_03415, partial [Anaerolineae bacterium]
MDSEQKIKGHRKSFGAGHLSLAPFATLLCLVLLLTSACQRSPRPTETLVPTLAFTALPPDATPAPTLASTSSEPAPPASASMPAPTSTPTPAPTPTPTSTPIPPVYLTIEFPRPVTALEPVPIRVLVEEPPDVRVNIRMSARVIDAQDQLYATFDMAPQGREG